MADIHMERTYIFNASDIYSLRMLYYFEFTIIMLILDLLYSYLCCKYLHFRIYFYRCYLFYASNVGTVTSVVSTTYPKIWYTIFLNYQNEVFISVPYRTTSKMSKLISYKNVCFIFLPYGYSVWLAIWYVSCTVENSCSQLK